MISQQQFKQSVLDNFKLYGHNNGTILSFNGLIGFVLIDNPHTIYSEVERLLQQACQDGWVRTFWNGSGLLVELVRCDDEEACPSTLPCRTPTTIPCPPSDTMLPPKAKTVINTNDYTCHCGRKCNKSERSCWWCSAPIMVK